ncbi:MULTISPECIES: glycosyltransferase [Streptomyces]|uniref:Glycosyl transferase n=1 Tax=Streptomyces spororaveus TaxID=284039 RepID=A0ABQ3TDM7_9ACTN|nr:MULTISPECIES: glycosyltransferase [Streptomyces]MCM9081080.1 glycosyltransferase [Streptomyces spororaveus]MCX5304473.1 glycosyltransferase [Streptomyces sp. NBC_00160]GHI78528.1 glycosyl transferase [Streptomyces spororaveus]
MKAKICLNMIVKDEAPVIRRCLESVRPLIDRWVILDTGSTDGTQDLVREVLGDLPGALHESPFRGFDASRSEAIDLARADADYLLFIDADDLMEVEPGFRMPELTEDAYRVALHDGPLVHWRPALVSTRLPWRYVGVLHEYIDCAGPYSLGTLTGAHIRSVGGGARLLRDGQRKKYLHDAAVLEAGLVKEPDNARYVFYLAQSWRDAGEPEKALAAYDRRAGMGGFAEEVFCARLYAARLAASTGRPDAEVMDRYLSAHESRPERAEALGDLARLCRVEGQRWPLAYLFARAAARIPFPSDVLFVEFDWYDWRALDELAVAAYWIGAYEESAECAERLLAGDKLPPAERDRVARNLAFAREKLGVADLVDA